MKQEISISCLDKKYPGFIWTTRCHELCGWNPVIHQWIVIEDGVCQDEDGEWCVMLYQLSSKDDPIGEGRKYYDSDKVIFDRRVKLVW